MTVLLARNRQPPPTVAAGAPHAELAAQLITLPSGLLAKVCEAIVKLTVPLFLCPSDLGGPVSDLFGPTNYAGCTGTGIDGGTPFATDGLFGINSRIRARDVRDGLSKTVAFSESILGSGPKATTSRDGIQTDTGYGFVFTTPLTEAACSRPFYYNFTDLRGFSWASPGLFQCTRSYHCTIIFHAPSCARFPLLVLTQIAVCARDPTIGRTVTRLA